MKIMSHLISQFLSSSKRISKDDRLRDYNISLISHHLREKERSVAKMASESDDMTATIFTATSQIVTATATATATSVAINFHRLGDQGTIKKKRERLQRVALEEVFKPQIQLRWW